MIFFYFFIIASCIFLLPLPTPIFRRLYIHTAFAPRLKLISVYTVFLCNIKSSDIKNVLAQKLNFEYTSFRFYCFDIKKEVVKFRT